MKILVVNGPNLNFLGIREKAIYGNQDYDYLCNMIKEKADSEKDEVILFQSNHEGAIIDRLQEAYFDGTDGIVINPGALKSRENITKVEVHISDISAREEFRKVSVTAPACDKQIYGHGLDGYLEAIDFIKEIKLK